jgi:N-methylhydantoinase A/oxoprolinase/acetone carboxylase beta subunit
MLLGIDAGGTHVDAVIIRDGAIAASSKLPTHHENLMESLRAALAALPAGLLRGGIAQVTLGATLALNAVLQNREEAVGLALCGGPGMAPARWALGRYTHVAPGGFDHRGTEVEAPDLRGLAAAAGEWEKAGVRVFAAVGKFSPRNPAFENAAARMLEPLGDVVCRGHNISGMLNFPRRVAGAYYNAAVWRLHNNFADAAQASLRDAGVRAPLFFLKADGGTIPLAASRAHPVHSLLSGPAAGVMGLTAMEEFSDDAFLLDMGGSSTDIALYARGIPVLEREGMTVRGRSTPVRALASRSIAVGGDSALGFGEDGISVGPLRHGPALAFGGGTPTLLDALNVAGYGSCGLMRASREGLAAFAARCGLPPEEAARQAVDKALAAIGDAARHHLARVNSRPVYTLAALLDERALAPRRAFLVGGPAALLRPLLERELNLPVHCPPYAELANAVGAALSLPTTELELFADTGRGKASVPLLDREWSVERSYDLKRAEADARRLLREKLSEEADGRDAGERETDLLESSLFAVIDERGRGAADIRVMCRARPGIARRLRA